MSLTRKKCVLILLFALHAIAYRDNNVKIIEHKLLRLSLSFNSTMLSGMCNFYTYLFSFKFSFLDILLFPNLA